MTMRLSLSTVAAAAGLLPSLASAGQFTYSPFTGDSDSGINSGLNYAAIADFAGNGTRTVNGVNFSNTGLSGTNYTLGLSAATFTGFVNSVTGVSNGLVSDFNYTGDGSGNATLTLTGLTPGQNYVTSWYNAGFGGAGGRQINITPSDTGTAFLFDENYTGAGQGNILRYSFTAPGTSISFGFDALSNGDSFHHYSMTTAVANNALLTTANVTALQAAGPGFFAPFSPSNTDLLQTSLSSASFGGAFTVENTGGVPILNNGQFSITGIGNNNPELATAGNGAFVQYDLNLAGAPLGFDISGIDTYGGWNDAGRDRQVFKISYSLVGSPDFVYLGAVDSNPAAGGNPSAVRAQFPTSLTGVDGIRVDWFGLQENGYAGIGEIDVFGTASVPEPAATGLLGLGALALLRRRRK